MLFQAYILYFDSLIYIRLHPDLISKISHNGFRRIDKRTQKMNLTFHPHKTTLEIITQKKAHLKRYASLSIMNPLIIYSASIFTELSLTSRTPPFMSKY